MKKEVKKLCVSACIIIVSLIAVDITWGVIADKLMQKVPYYGSDIAKEKYALRGINQDIMIFGSSRALTHFVPSILKDSIDTYLHKNYTIYNGGIDKKTLDCNLMLIENSINRGVKGKLVVLEADNVLFYRDNSNVYDFAQFYKSDTIVKRYIDNLGFNTKLRMQSNLYRFNFRLSRVLLDIIKNAKPNDGYAPQYKVMKIQKRPQLNDKKSTLNDYTYSTFVRVMDMCKKNNVNIVVVSAPRYGNNHNTQAEQEHVLYNICKEKNIPYFNMVDEPQFDQHPELFKDAGHLNDSGARIFTKMFFEKLKPYLDSMK